MYTYPLTQSVSRSRTRVTHSVTHRGSNLTRRVLSILHCMRDILDKFRSKVLFVKIVEISCVKSFLKKNVETK